VWVRGDVDVCMYVSMWKALVLSVSMSACPVVHVSEGRKDSVSLGAAKRVGGMEYGRKVCRRERGWMFVVRIKTCFQHRQDMMGCTCELKCGV
jgi:hypothetical protein